MKYFFAFALGMVVIIVFLNIIKKQTPKADSSKLLADVLKTPEALELAKTPQFAKLLKTKELQNYAKTLAKEELTAFANNVLK